MEARHGTLPLIAAEAKGAVFLILRPAWSIQFQDNREYIEPVSKRLWWSQGKSHSSEVPEFVTRKVCAVSSSCSPMPVPTRLDWQII